MLLSQDDLNDILIGCTKTIIIQSGHKDIFWKAVESFDVQATGVFNLVFLPEIRRLV